MRIFVAGTGTDVGKTVVSAWLCLKGNMDYFKPVQTGSESGTDSDWIQSLGIRVHPESYCYPKPFSPHYAAFLAGDEINTNNILLPNSKDLVVEGAGGLLVPLNNQYLMIDLIQKLQLPVVLAASGMLGTINHTLMSLEILRARNIDISGVVVSGEYEQHNIDAIAHHGRVRILAVIPQMQPVSKEALLRVEGELP